MTLKRFTQLVKSALDDYDDLWLSVYGVAEGTLRLDVDGEQFVIEITKVK